MQWIHKREENPSVTAPLFSAVEIIGLNARIGTPALAMLEVTSRLDLSAEYEVSGNEILHRVYDGDQPVGTVKDVFTEEEWVREFSLTLPLSFYFANLPNHPVCHITPNRLYQEDGTLIIRAQKDADAGLYFQAENAIVHTEGNQLLLTAKQGYSRFTFRYVK